MSVTISGDSGLAGAATGALNGTLGATTPSTVVATTVTATTVNSALNGTLGATTPNTIAATSITASGAITTSNSIEVDGTVTTGISTTNVQIYTPSLTSGKSFTYGILIVAGHDAANNSFIDLVTFFANATAQTPSAIASGTVYGTPSARTYTGGSNTVSLRMASGTYSVAVSPFKVSFP